MEDEMHGVVTFELDGGRRVRVDARTAREIGPSGVAKYLGIETPRGRLPVRQGGELVGTVPADFDPYFIRSKSFLYDPRPGDFTREGTCWIANAALGLGDLEAVPGFVRA
jgi:hypothetical protein